MQNVKDIGERMRSKNKVCNIRTERERLKEILDLDFRLKENLGMSPEMFQYLPKTH